MPVEKLPAEILPFVQPNRVIDPNSLATGARIYDFVNENGDNLGKVVEETVTGNNGIIYKLNNFLTTTGAAAGTYLTTGLAATTVEVSVASTAWMAALGISGGAILYQAMPDLFTKISDAIFGDFVDGLPVVYFDRYGRLQLEEKTVNTVKDTLIANKAYLEGFDLKPAGDTEVLTALRNYSGAIFESTYTPQPVIDQYTDIDTILEYSYSFIHKYSYKAYVNASYQPDYGNPYEYDYFCYDVASKNAYYDIMKRFMELYPPGQYLYGLMQPGGAYTPRTGLSYTIYAVPYKLLRNMVNNVEFPLYCDYYDENDVHYENVLHTTKYKMDARMRNAGYSSGETVYGDDSINGDWLYSLVLRPVRNEDCLGYFEYIETYAGSYYSWTDTYNPWRLITTTKTVAGATITEYNYLATDPDLCVYQCTPRGGTEISTLIDNKEYSGNIEYYNGDLDLLNGTRVTTFLSDLRTTFGPLQSLHPMGIYGYRSYDSDNRTYFPMYGKLTVADYIDNRWKNPAATIPVENEDVSTTYPNWPAQVVQGIGNLLTVTPQQLNPTGDQAVAQSPGDEIDPLKWIEYFAAILNVLKPDPDPAPDPSPEPEPTPQPSPDPSPDPVPQPQPDPVDPNTPVVPDPTPIIDPTLTPISSSKLFTVYNPTANQLDQLGAYLWSPSFITAIEKIWQDPLSAIISLRRVYANPTSSSTQNIILGYLDSGVTGVKVVDSQFVTKSCGYINVEEVMHNATDYSPYTQAHIYLPFIGIQEIDIDDIMSGRLTVRYTFDMYTGVCLAELIVLRSDLTPEKMLYTFSGNAAQEVPLTSATAQGFFSTLMQIGGSALAVAGGGALGIAAGANMIGHSLTHEMIHIARSGNLSANAGIMGNRYPQLILSNRNRYDANSYNTIYGYPANKTVYLGNCSGFTQVKAINLKTFATQPEKEEIETLLKSGVIF